MASKEKIAVTIAALCEAFNRSPTKATFMAYEIGLGDISDEQLDRAALATLQSASQKFMPTPGELRALALTEGRGVESRVDEAWSTLNRAIDKFGAGRSVNFRDGLINATVRMLGGWERICQLPVEEFEKWFQKDFRATYSRFMQSGPPVDSAGYLVGETERVNGTWVGFPCLKDGKIYELPMPEEMDSPYKPLIESPPATTQIGERPADIPRVEFRKSQ